MVEGRLENKGIMNKKGILCDETALDLGQQTKRDEQLYI